jgi:uncharacterized protein (DUF302 family)
MNTGLISQNSPYSAIQTMEKIASLVQANGMTIFMRLDHAQNAKTIGLSLRPTELIVFGNPKAGTILMEDNQATGLDLPLKALVWEDESCKTWVTYEDPRWISARHQLTSSAGPIVNSIAESIKELIETALAE